jgi:hypothetical protein
VHHSPHSAAAPDAPPPLHLGTSELRASHHNVAPNPRTYTTTPDAFPAAHAPIPDASTAAPAPTRASSGSQLCCRCTVVVGSGQKGVVLLAPPYRVSYHPGAPTAAASDREAPTAAANDREAPTASTSDREASTPAAACGSRDDFVPL